MDRQESTAPGAAVALIPLWLQHTLQKVSNDARSYLDPEILTTYLSREDQDLYRRANLFIETVLRERFGCTPGDCSIPAYSLPIFQSHEVRQAANDAYADYDLLDLAVGTPWAYNHDNQDDRDRANFYKNQVIFVPRFLTPPQYHSEHVIGLFAQYRRRTAELDEQLWHEWFERLQTAGFHIETIARMGMITPYARTHTHLPC